MKINYSSVARFLATLSIVVFLVLPAANGGNRCRQIYYPQVKLKPVISRPIVPSNSSGPIAPDVKSSELEIATQPITILSIRKQIAASLAKTQNPSIVLINPPSNFNLTASAPTRFSLLNISRKPAVKAFQETTPFKLVPAKRGGNTL